MRQYKTTDGLTGVALCEWEHVDVPGLALSRRDLRLAERLAARSADARVEVRRSLSGVEINTQGSIGLVRFEHFELQIEPKLPGGTVQLFRMIDFATGLHVVERLNRSARINLGGANLLDLVVDLLAVETSRLVRSGLRADYVTREEGLPVLRGRLLADRQILERGGEFDRLICRYDEHEHDITDNRLLAFALARGARVALDESVRRRARTMAALLAEVCDPAAYQFGPREEIGYDRANDHYRDAHELAWLLLEGAGANEELASAGGPARSLLIDMNDLFERFVERVVETVLPRPMYRVRGQKANVVVWDCARGAPYSRIKPDLLVGAANQRSRRLPVDAKYKQYGVNPGARKIDSADLSQAFLYAYAYRQPDGPDSPHAVLVYPSGDPGALQVRRLEVRGVAERAVDAVIYGIGIHIPTVLDELASPVGGPSTATMREILGGIALGPGG